MALSRNFFYYSTLVMITVMTYGFSTASPGSDSTAHASIVFFFCHVSEQAICYQRWILFVFSIFLTAYHHGTATEMEGMKAKDTVLYSASSTRRAEHSNAHITPLLAAHM
jgi:hypothetical protein